MLNPSRSRHLSRAAVLDAGRAVALGGTIRTHLEDCEPCQARVRPWKALATLARRWEETRPPEAAVLRAKTLAGASSTAVRPVRLRAVLQHLGPGILLPAGARGPLLDDHDAYQVVYHAEEFSVDLRVSRTLSRRRVIVVGQIKHLARPSQRLGNIPVLLTSRNRVAVRTLSNEWGEFSFEHEDQEHMWLEVAPEPGRCIRIPIKSRPAPAPRPER